MTRERIVDGRPLSEVDETFSWSLRPKTLSEYIGQKNIVEKLSISIQAARGRGEPHEHVLFYGPPGLGKTTLANVISHEMGTNLVATSGPALERTGDLMGLLTNLEHGDVLFIDEIHRLPRVIEEFVYPAMEDFQVDFLVDKGAFAKSIKVQLKHFTLVGATTRAGFLTAPFRERFGIYHYLDFYPPEEIAQIIWRSSRILGIEIEAPAVDQLAKRSRGTPRVANRLLRRVRDFAEVKRDGRVEEQVAVEALDLEGIDARGLDELDRKFLHTIIEHYGGGPVGINALSATLNEEADTLEDMVEPYLLKIGFVNRTRQGRVATDRAFEHLGFKRGSRQKELF
ncbi:MAG: Holliday junction branch migration DNA helicase RuvB [Candidatus Abyssobacteria bacterium SURF_17]|uniref:Holliday junction branch migration complex subunit RuvB n=1 Tax=Candidatus Abyssobacteria bacterium SURF_17 TaxID=2093361 RepID=A0A419F695_9BACT|nr:MAG: Holliday junction branch migration DNA helicase RuvB [Candidatus Abyssubacteria bacterium SURF_17]